MKTILNIAVTAFLLMVASSQCFALQENVDVSREQAKEMGVALRSNPNGEAGVKVWLEFKTAGALKNFTHVDLEITAGEKRLVDAPLLTERPTPDSVSVHFSADPALLATSVLEIVVQDGPRTRIGYRLQVQDFIELKAGAKQSAAAALPVYETAEQVKAMPPGKAKVEHIETFFSRLRTADGKQFVIGSERGEQEVWNFVGTALKKGQTYEFPTAFHDYQNRKFYATADEIKAMPPLKATLEQTRACDSIFRAADGKQFVIGNPGSKAEVRQFLKALKEGESYEFPGAFLDYQKKK